MQKLKFMTRTQHLNSPEKGLFPKESVGDVYSPLVIYTVYIKSGVFFKLKFDTEIYKQCVCYIINGQILNYLNITEILMAPSKQATVV